MKSILISVQPQWCEKIFNKIGEREDGKPIYEKTVEVRKSRPKIETPFMVYIYCTHNGATRKEKDRNIYTDFSGKVIGEFVCNEITDARDMGGDEFYSKSCLTYEDWRKYTDGTKNNIWLWHISNLKIYDKPRSLSEFCTVDNKAVQNCKNRRQTYHQFTDTGYIKNGFYCEETQDWCIKCKTKPLTRPPQSWCYVEERKF